MIHIYEAPGSNLGQHTGYHDFDISSVQVYREQYIKAGHDHFLLHASYFVIN